MFSNSMIMASKASGGIPPTFDLANATYSGFSLSTGAEGSGSPRGLAASPSGAKIMVLDFTDDAVYQFSLGAGQSLNGASFDILEALSFIDSGYGLTYSPDGTKIISVDDSDDDLQQYEFGTVDDVSTLSHDGISGIASRSYRGVCFAGPISGTGVDGSVLLVSTSVGVRSYALTTHGSIDGGVNLMSQVSLPGPMTGSGGLMMSPNGEKLFAVDSASQLIYQFTPGSNPANPMDGITYDSVSLDLSSQLGTPRDLTFSPDGTKMFVVGTTNDTIYEYS